MLMIIEVDSEQRPDGGKLRKGERDDNKCIGKRGNVLFNTGTFIMRKRDQGCLPHRAGKKNLVV